MQTSVKVPKKQGFFALLAGKTTALATTFTLSAYGMVMTAYADESKALSNPGILKGA